MRSCRVMTQNAKHCEIQCGMKLTTPSTNMCCKFDPNVRPKAIEVLNGFLKKEHDTAILKSKEANIYIIRAFSTG